MGMEIMVTISFEMDDTLVVGGKINFFQKKSAYAG